MYDANRMEQYLAATGLMIEEFKLLNTIHVRNKYPENTDLLKKSNLYYTRHNFYDRDTDKPTPISWYQMVESLQRRGFILTYPNYVRQQGTQMYIDFTRLEVTDLFLESIYAKDVDVWWKDFKEIYGVTMYVRGMPVSTLTGDQGETPDDVKAKWLELTGNGDKGLMMEMQARTVDYVRVFGNNMKLIKYLRNYAALMESLDAVLAQNRDDSSWTESV